VSWEADAGRFENEWLKLSERFENIALHEYVIMPNHFHTILETVGATLTVAQTHVVVQNKNGQPQGIAWKKDYGRPGFEFEV